MSQEQIDRKKRLEDNLQEIADNNDSLVMSFIAPDTIVRNSPISYDYAKITIQDLYQIEKKVEELRKANALPKKIKLVIHTPGGRVDASTKIAKYLQRNFDEIIAYVPYEAASGGTMLCLAASKIVMCSTSSLTPIDPQVEYKGQRISATTYKQIADEFKNTFSTLSPGEIPSPFQQMINKFDPIMYKEMEKTVYDSLIVAVSLLEKSQNATTDEEMEKIYSIAFSLGKTGFPHSHLIDIDDAKRMQLPIDESAEELENLQLFKQWVSSKLNNRETNHIIEAYSPKNEKIKNEKKPASKKKK